MQGLGREGRSRAGTSRGVKKNQDMGALSSRVLGGDGDLSSVMSAPTALLLWGQWGRHHYHSMERLGFRHQEEL